jgi:hypothetical protein
MASCDPGVGYKGIGVHFFAGEERGGAGVRVCSGFCLEGSFWFGEGGDEAQCGVEVKRLGFMATYVRYTQ